MQKIEGLDFGAFHESAFMVRKAFIGALIGAMERHGTPTNEQMFRLLAALNLDLIYIMSGKRYDIFKEMTDLFSQDLNMLAEKIADGKVFDKDNLH